MTGSLDRQQAYSLSEPVFLFLGLCLWQARMGSYKLEASLSSEAHKNK